ncbi:hypothetical protein HS088_TW14G00678 [Tripterygium wilfordii]|uniref:laccase n=1 Tax=Tripterygium wilfordii TaxID=458696 RepID=A0A7J7CR59_TRIWF|nr:hypothetical protein HS088_TW14G00678 [Tripterygium wilfordii]
MKDATTIGDELLNTLKLALHCVDPSPSARPEVQQVLHQLEEIKPEAVAGEWWNADPISVVRQATRTGAAPNISDAYTINGQPGDLYNCSSNDTVIVPINSGETNLIRVINAALNQELFFTIANHKFTVVGADAGYLKPFTTSVIMLGPGQTTDVLIKGDQAPGRYYIAAIPYQREWWDANPMDVVRESTRTGGSPNISDAYTINGQPGDLYNCSSKDTSIVPIDFGETNLLRIINAGLNQPLFFTVANHRLTVVGADASYIKPFTTSVVVLGPGQTTDVLITGDQPPGRYYIAARAYHTALNVPFDNTTTTAILDVKAIFQELLLF